MRFSRTTALAVASASLLTAIFASTSPAQDKPARPKPEDTEVWKPEPPVVTPGPATEQPTALPPSDAVVLFDGKNVDQWVAVGTQDPAKWTVDSDGTLKVKKGTGNIETKHKFKDYQLHVEYRIPENISGTSQGRGNSGIFLASTGGGDAGYELQILDNFNNKTYVNGMAGSIYKQAIPLANACRKPGEWQTYDVAWTAPRFAADGSVQSPAAVTVVFNGVLVLNHFVLKGETAYIGAPKYKPYDTAPIKLQAHGDASAPISFRNIWAREIAELPAAQATDAPKK
jgi:hypothetical protein